MPLGFAAKLSIPRLQSSVYVVDAKSAQDLRRGPGYIEGSSRPGEDGNCLIAGHRDLHFRILKNVKVGDDITVESPNGSFSYRVSSIEIVNPKNAGALRRRFPRQLTLITCYPFYYLGPAPQRLIVRAAIQ
jgi:sortase A